MHTGRQFRRTKLENTFPIVVRSLSDWPFYMHRVLRLGNHSWLLLNGLDDGTSDHCGKCQCLGGRCLEQDVSISVFRSPLVVIFEVHPTLRRILTIQCPQRLEHVEVLKVPNLEKEDVTMVSVQSSRAILVE